MLPPWNVNAVAEELIRLMAKNRTAYEMGRRRVVRDSKQLGSGLSQVEGLTVFPTNANFVYGELEASIPGKQLRDILLQQSGCFVRECGSKIGSGSQFLRIATRPQPQHDFLIGALQQAIGFVLVGSRRNGKLHVQVESGELRDLVDLVERTGCLAAQGLPLQL